MPQPLTIDCPCGWTDTFSKAYSGLLIECPTCGKSHRIPTFDSPEADTGIDMSMMKKLLEPAGETSVNFKPLFTLSLAFAVVVSAIALPLLWERWPVNAAVVGGAFAWPLAIGTAWLGQRRHLKKLAASRD